MPCESQVCVWESFASCWWHSWPTTPWSSWSRPGLRPRRHLTRTWWRSHLAILALSSFQCFSSPILLSVTHDSWWCVLRCQPFFSFKPWSVTTLPWVILWPKFWSDWPTSPVRPSLFSASLSLLLSQLWSRYPFHPTGCCLNLKQMKSVHYFKLF